MPKIVNLIGKKFGRLTVKEKNGSRNNRTTWLCECKCGNTITAITCNLTTGHTKSCGCLKKEPWAKTHGMKKTPEYEAWGKIKSRCYNKNSKDYKYYGSRGIKVCDRWKDSFVNFYHDMGKRPTRTHSIDRINNEMGYSPDNCKWSTPIEQANNKRNNVTIKINGEVKTLAEWCRFHNINYSVARSRISYGWPAIKALTTPLLR